MIPPIDAVYEKFKHLDGCLSDPEWCKSGDGAAIYAIAGELWRAVKEARNLPAGTQQPEPEHVMVIRELRNALFAASNRYHDLKLRCKCNTMNELQFRTLVESALLESENYKPDYETGDPLDWRRRNE